MTQEEAIAVIRQIITNSAEEYRPIGGVNRLCYTVPQIQAVNAALDVLEAD